MRPDPTLEVVTLDTNNLNRHFPVGDLEALVNNRTICVSDLVVAETLNHPNWQKWAMDNFAKLYAHRERVYCVNSLPHYMQIELDTGKPTSCATANSAATANFQAVIRDSVENRPKVTQYLGDMSSHVIQSLQDRKNSLWTRIRDTEDFFLHTLQVVGDERAKETAYDYRLFPQLLADLKFIEFAGQVLERTPHCQDFDATHMAESHCIWSRYFYATFAYIIRSHDQPPRSQLKPKVILNDHNDEDIIIVGSYTNQTITDDGKAGYVNNALRLCLEELSDLKVSARSPLPDEVK